jgi:hypothetical protein
MSNRLGDNGNHVRYRGSLVTGIERAKIVAGNKKIPVELVTVLSRQQMTREASPRLSVTLSVQFQ